ncbi:hypothetical protein PPERSA_08156 [Pseudocohnilembus persalinus]|uniref:Uncharacterized protein n=1 Tax=Pseudocohnilembus persalinus TaxID=266149 RepID=A0A0V0R371_PSEPJ|nr:hypothetical protein PPERSA_08156 [Pseudocohnilembus persalinus]|eukprot:KRX08953.1 hypothetical protein PPERSA_08156 [Pseudocohnilembus persalinus]
MQSDKFQQQLGKCTEKGHERHFKNLICTEKKCKSESKLICVKCLCEKHSNHSDKCIFIEDIFSCKSNNVPNWSEQIVANKIEEIQQTQNEYEEYPIPINYIREVAIQEVENQRYNLKSMYNNKGSYNYVWKKII